MLILTRRVGQTVTIGDDVEITVIQISGDQVRLGINAPRQVKVYRKEVLDQIALENAAAAASAADLEEVESALRGPEKVEQTSQEGSSPSGGER